MFHNHDTLSVWWHNPVPMSLSSSPVAAASEPKCPVFLGFLQCPSFSFDLQYIDVNLVTDEAITAALDLVTAMPDDDTSTVKKLVDILCRCATGGSLPDSVRLAMVRKILAVYKASGLDVSTVDILDTYSNVRRPHSQMGMWKDSVEGNMTALAAVIEMGSTSDRGDF